MAMLSNSKPAQPVAHEAEYSLLEVESTFFLLQRSKGKRHFTLQAEMPVGAQICLFCSEKQLWRKV